MSVRNTPLINRLNLKDGQVAGPGGRSSATGKNITIFGATGFLGGYVVEQLGKKGNNMVVATHGDDMSWRHLRTTQDLGRLVPSYFSLKDEDSVRESIAGADVVINLMGKKYETKSFPPSIINYSFDDVNVTGAELVARIAREENVKHLVHVSSAQADKNSASRFAQTKAIGEDKVKEQFPGAVIVRPNIMYGEMDHFLDHYQMHVRFMNWIPLIGGGSSLMSPVYVADVGTAIGTIAENYVSAGENFNLSGTNEYTTKEVYEYVMHVLRMQRSFVDVPDAVAEKATWVMDKLPNPYFTTDQVKLAHQDAVRPQPGDKTFSDLGIDKIADFESKAELFFGFRRQGSHFDDLR
eukprot:CAMPEP_0203756302 /NCGR_PEP_ID=MMETSP0098-20131031/9598_1 /ASSEMBLY_ACC=CAM_ASM_000208 /TAXON_ID=96639 /ORGANISM=" , Strain NY0313808BC1" /LENGTH=351 /DNA_ID=CAMNT_0050648131 /DNA_START=281 /DNA_END=1339 /DNA_ORIENTATION=-